MNKKYFLACKMKKAYEAKIIYTEINESEMKNLQQFRIRCFTEIRGYFIGEIYEKKVHGST